MSFHFRLCVSESPLMTIINTKEKKIQVKEVKGGKIRRNGIEITVDRNNFSKYGYGNTRGINLG